MRNRNLVTFKRADVSNRWHQEDHKFEKKKWGTLIKLFLLHAALLESLWMFENPVVLLFHVTAQQHTTAYSVSVIFWRVFLLGGNRIKLEDHSTS